MARISRDTKSLLERVGPGDIVVLDQLDIDRMTAQELVAAEVTAVVNASPSVSGRYPNVGPDILLAADIALVDEVGDDVFSAIKDGAKIRLLDGAVYVGDTVAAQGLEQTAETIADLLIEAKAGMAAQLEAFAANAIEYVKRERALLLDGVGIPQIDTKLAGKHVMVVMASPDSVRELKKLRTYISDYHPVMIGVDGGADAIVAAGYKPAVVVGDPELMSLKALKSGAEVVIPAESDGHAPGLERLQDLALGAVTFPAAGSSMELALLLADHADAALMVTVGVHASLTDVLDRSTDSSASTFLIRLRVSNKMIDARAAAQLYKARISWWVVALLVLAAAGAIVTALLVSDVSGTYANLIVGWWNDLVGWVRGLF